MKDYFNSVLRTCEHTRDICANILEEVNDGSTRSAAGRYHRFPYSYSCSSVFEVHSYCKWYSMGLNVSVISMPSLVETKHF